MHRLCLLVPTLWSAAYCAIHGNKHHSSFSFPFSIPFCTTAPLISPLRQSFSFWLQISNFPLTHVSLSASLRLIACLLPGFVCISVLFLVGCRGGGAVSMAIYVSVNKHIPSLPFGPSLLFSNLLHPLHYYLLCDRVKREWRMKGKLASLSEDGDTYNTSLMCGAEDALWGSTTLSGKQVVVGK